MSAAYQAWLGLGQNFELGKFAVTSIAFKAGYAAGLAADVVPVDMVLHCPKCGLQHVDAAERRECFDCHIPGGCVVGACTDGAFASDVATAWKNPPHRPHLCAGCGHTWRPADIPTNGVATIQTRGTRDSPTVEPARPAMVDVTTLASHKESVRALHQAWYAIDDHGPAAPLGHEDC